MAGEPQIPLPPQGPSPNSSRQQHHRPPEDLPRALCAGCCCRAGAGADSSSPPGLALVWVTARVCVSACLPAAGAHTCEGEVGDYDRLELGRDAAGVRNCGLLSPGHQNPHSPWR